MLNHARTLLLNEAGAKQPEAFGEYIDPSYVPVRLPQHLDEFHKIIYGERPSREHKNYRARQLLGICHASPVEDMILALDPRVTYLPFRPVSLPPMPGLISLPKLLDPLSYWCDQYGNILFRGTEFNRLLDLWRGPIYTDRLAGLTMTVIYRTEELRCEMEKCQVLGMD